MDKLDAIREPLKEELSRYEEFMKEALQSDSPYVAGIMDYIILNRGKGIRPMLAMLLAGIHSRSGVLNKRVYLAAMLVEMIHNASLVHDDVVDAASVRHGQPSVNTQWSNRVSVLSGDYILARSFSSGMLSGQFDIVSYISSGVSELAEGELIQNDYNARLEMTREVYFRIIYKKTATLLGMSSGAGALAAGASAAEVALAREVGINLGMAFQIKDDILDYAPQEQTGKPFCADLLEKKITLPLLVILENSDPLQRRLIMGKVECIDKDPSELTSLHELVVREGGISASAEVMHEYIDRARRIISAYPESPYRHSLEMLCDYVGVRER